MKRMIFRAAAAIAISSPLVFACAGSPSASNTVVPVVGGSSSPTAQAPSPDDAGSTLTITPKDVDANESVTLDRSECYGRCPVYRVEIKGDGTVRYDGMKFVRVEGARTSRAPAEKVAALFAHFHRAGFAGMNAEYTYPVTDNPTATLTLHWDGQTKEVRDYPPCHEESYGDAAAPPPELCALEKEVDEVAATKQWVECIDDKGAPAPYCR
jgi:hypothetical protein